jgi:hypothetical protein
VLKKFNSAKFYLEEVRAWTIIKEAAINSRLTLALVKTNRMERRPLRKVSGRNWIN